MYPLYEPKPHSLEVRNLQKVIDDLRKNRDEHLVTLRRDQKAIDDISEEITAIKRAIADC